MEKNLKKGEEKTHGKKDKTKKQAEKKGKRG
jgi:hypothetical protein